MKIKSLTVSVALSLFFVSTSFAASIDKAIMLNQYGLAKEAKAELIDIIFSKSDDSRKAHAYYLLGSIAFEENKIAVALDSWRELSKKYPNSEQAKTVNDRINELAEIVGESTKESIKNAVALSYLRHGDFWSRGKDDRFTIDSSWIPNVETAIKWYDKVISEFPKSVASRVAYQDNMRTLLGWEEPGRYGFKRDQRRPLMGHILFCILHILAIAFGFVFLFITIPLHIIYACVRKKKKKIPVTN